jgi:hypothetical protein
MTVFQDAVDTRYADENTTINAFYRARGTGTPTSVRLKIGLPDEEVTLGRSRIRISTAMGRVRVSEVPDLKISDTFTVGTEVYKIKTLDRGPRRLEWIIEFQ